LLNIREVVLASSRRNLRAKFAFIPTNLLMHKDLGTGGPTKSFDQLCLAARSCGTPPAPRKRTLSDIGRLRECQQASVAEVMAFIEREKLYGLGCGFVDITLRASTLITINAELWTFDQRLSKLATRFGVGFST
jgi:hypothetical protein